MKQREATGETIANLLGPTQIEKNRYYIKSIGEVVKFLAVNELLLRGSLESTHDDQDVSAGLFLKRVEYTLAKDPKLYEITKSIPQNAKYTSKNIQNEIIDTLANLVLHEIKNKYDNADHAGFSIKSDGTRDRCNVENLSIMSQQYDVPSLKRLLEIRWTSHHDVTKCLMENQDGIISILSEVSEDSAAAVDICTEASGLLMMLRKHHFLEVGGFLLKVLGALRPANAILQAHSVYLCCAGEVISASLQALRGMRDDESLTNFDIDDRAPAPAVKRKRTMCSQLTGSVVLPTVGHTEDSMTPRKSLKRALLNILDRAIVEMEARFSRGNLDLMKAVNFLLPQSPSFLDVGMTL